MHDDRLGGAVVVLAQLLAASGFPALWIVSVQAAPGSRCWPASGGPHGDVDPLRTTDVAHSALDPVRAVVSGVALWERSARHCHFEHGSARRHQRKHDVLHWFDLSPCLRAVETGAEPPPPGPHWLAIRRRYSFGAASSYSRPRVDCGAYCGQIDSPFGFGTSSRLTFQPAALSAWQDR